jgi:preprotein translocase subunit SecG
VLIAVVLVLIILLQSAKGTDVGSAFGGMGSQAAFGPRGTATLLSKATVGLGITFMLTSVVLSMMGRESVAGDSVLRDDESTATETAPAPETPVSPSPDAPQGVPVSIPGMEGVRATVTVENPEDAEGQTSPDADAEDEPSAESPQPSQ